MTDVPVYRPGKRKRGRPRKDSNLLRENSLYSPLNLNTIIKTQTPEIKSPRSPHDPRTTGNVDINYRDGTGNGMVGRMIYGVIEGSFDAGYFISVRMANGNTPFRGVIFHSEKVVPVTATNDIAPNAKMYQRREVPVYNLPSPQSRKVIMQPSQATKQENLHPFRPSTSQTFTTNDNFSSHSTFMLAEEMVPRNDLCSNVGERMANKSEAMHMFGFSTPPKESRSIAESSFNATINSLLENESINHNHKPTALVQDKQNNSNVEIRQKFMADTPQSAFETQNNNEMIGSEMQHQVHNGWESPTFQLQEVAQGHSVTKELQAVNPQHEQTNLYHHSEMKMPDDIFQNQFTYQSQSTSPNHKCSPRHYADHVSNSPNLELDLTSSMHEKPDTSDHTSLETNYLVMNEMESPNLGYHQALVSGNLLLLPPDFSGEHLDFNPKSPSRHKSTQQANLKQKSGAAEGGERFQDSGVAGYAEAGTPSAPEYREDARFKLKLGSTQFDGERRSGTQMGSSTGCITDMDFVLSDVIPTTKSHGR